MIFFRPCINSECPDEITFEALEDDILCGSCVMIIKDDKAEIISAVYNKDKPYVVEGLIKSAFNLACSKNCYMGYCKCENISAFLDKMNFQFKDGIYFNDVPSVLMGNCCKKCP